VAFLISNKINMEHSDDNTTLIGTISGTILSIIATFDLQDIVKTIILAAVGAAVSFLVSRGLKWVWEKWSEK
jgi:galactitol-specific phosphotransferase system IIC component